MSASAKEISRALQPFSTLFSPRGQKSSTKIIGRAYTVYNAGEDDPAPPVKQHYIDSMAKDCELYIGAPRGIFNAVYGGLMNTRAQIKGAVGAVAHGRLRDLRERWNLNYPVFAQDNDTAVPFRAAKAIRINVGLHLSNGVADYTANPGNWIVGDVDGVIVIPQQCAPPAIDLMRGRSAEDKITAEALKSGMSFTEATRRYRTYLRWLGTYVNGFESRSVWICRQGNLFARPKLYLWEIKTPRL